MGRPTESMQEMDRRSQQIWELLKTKGVLIDKILHESSSLFLPYRNESRINLGVAPGKTLANAVPLLQIGLSHGGACKRTFQNASRKIQMTASTKHMVCRWSAFLVCKRTHGFASL